MAFKRAALVWDDGEMSELHGKEKFDNDRDLFMAKAIEADDGLWTKHDWYHWSRTVNGERLDYWPTRKKFQWRGRVMRGNVWDIINRFKSKEAQ